MKNKIWFMKEWIKAWTKWIFNRRMTAWERFVIEIGS